MKEKRFFQSPINQGGSEITGPEAHHLIKVMRCQVGDSLELFDGKGCLAQASIVEVKSKKVLISITSIEQFPARDTQRIILAVSLAKGERFDWLISKCSELGVDHIIPVLYERTVKKGSGKNILERFEHLAIAAAKQSERLFLPQIDSPMSLSETLEHCQTLYPHAQWLIGSLNESAKPVTTLSWQDEDVIVFIGPEGGFADSEESLLLSHPSLALRISDTILRTETAGMAFGSYLAALRVI